MSARPKHIVNSTGALPVTSDHERDTSRSQLVRDLYAAYTKGKRVPRAATIQESLQKFLQSVEGYVRPRLSAYDQAVCVICKHACEQARDAIERDAVEESCQYIGKALSVASIRSAGAEARHRCYAEILPVEAYIDLRCGDAEAARRHYIESLKADQRLEDEFGPTWIHAHRIQVAIRLTAVEAIASRWERATDLTVGLFMYLAGRTQALPLPGDWGPKYMTTLSPDMVQLLALQLTYELSGWLAPCPAAMVREVMGRILASEAFSDEGARSFWNTSTLNWVQHKMLSCGATPRFLWNSLFFLEEGPGPSISIWLTGALDTVRACDALDSDAAVPFKADVLGSITALKYVPVGLQRAARHMGRGIAQSHRSISKTCGDTGSSVYHTTNHNPNSSNCPSERTKENGVHE